jgi:hypothetical protein
MRYNAFYGELPLEAFKPIAGRMRLYGGGDPISAVSDAVQGAINTVSDIGVQIDQGVRNTIPGGWTTAALLAGGYYYAPEIGAYLNSTTGATVPLAEVADASVVTPNIGTLPQAGPGVQVASNSSYLPELTPASALPPTAPPVTTPISDLTTLAPNASSGTGFTQLGGQGLTGDTLGNLSTMGGGQGLTGLSTAGTPINSVGGALNAGGIGGALGTTAAGSALGTGLPAADTSFLSSLIPSTPMGQIAATQGLTGLGSALIGSSAAQKAADIQSAAAQNATALQGQMFNQINQQQAPYRTAGYNALNQLGGLGSGQYQQYDANGNPTTMGTGTGYLTKQFSPADLQAGLAPNYDFMLQQGQMANQRAANVGGGALGGNALQGLQNYTQNYAGNAYQNAFNNYQSQRTGIYNTLAGIAGIGQTGQNATNQAAQNATTAQTQLGVGSAAAQAAGQVGTAGAYGNALGQLGSGLTLASLLNQRGNATLPTA